MKWLSALLLLGVCVRHFTAHNIGAQTYLNARGWFYVMGGLWEAMLCGILLMLVLEAQKSPYRLIAAFALIVGMAEAMQMSVCRALVVDMKTIPIGANICDHVAGLPVTATINTLYLLILAVLIGVQIREPHG